VTVTAPAGLAVEVRRDGGESWRGAAAELAAGAVARIVDGPLVHELRLVERPAAARLGIAPDLDLGFARRLIGAGLLAAAVVAASFVVSLEDPGLGDRPLPRKFLHVFAERPPRPSLPRIDRERLDPAAFRQRTAAVGARVDGQGRNRRGVEGHGILAALHDLGDGGGVFSAGIGVGVNEAIGDLRAGGSGLAEVHGVGGLGPRGGSGAGSTGLGIHGLTGDGRALREGLAFGPVGGREAVRVSPGKITVVGGLSKDVIGRHIRDRQRQVLACYERELQKDPNLEGKLAVSFVIDGAGNVTEVTVLEDTLGQPEVARCAAAKIRGWRFPAPDGGGQVIVNYPWIFRAAGVE
jgi:hypothetical protein